MAETPTQRWLRQNVHALPYTQKERVYSQVNAALDRFLTLRPKTDVYTYDDGRTQLLLCVHGLLPISFRQAAYNIPISLWIPHDFPRIAPLSYVVPTSDMIVKASKHLDVSGRLSLPYIMDWEKKPEACNISALLEAMQDQFSREPPVYAKPTEEAPSSSTRPAQTLSGSTPPVPPKPGIPPPAFVGSQSVAPSAASTTSQAMDFSPSHANNSPPVPERPPPPPQYTSGPRYAASPQYTASLADSTLSNSPWLPHFLQPRRPPPPVPQPPAPSTQLVSHPVSAQVPVPSPPAPPPPPVPIPPSEVVSPQSTSRAPPPNLLDGDAADVSEAPVAAPPPPRPPNPELLSLHAAVHAKLTSELASLTQALSLDAERLRGMQADLLQGEAAIRDERGRLEAVRDVCVSVRARVGTVVSDAERELERVRARGEPEVDELVCGTSIVHNQLINLVAEDNAIEDTMYHLHRALTAGRIDLERFLRSARVLAEEQFMKRALIEKIQAGMSLGAMSG
ncbi:UEV-domain-containing protein [Fistulina hepatica ATCC 64428]|uniref:UEV-domain-containing protein n=1 Tax=Fistulina hepatica ATCC 64428 TaxID=1128425 RepID=A0A0D7A6S4_9AGAR|nr:UEV-domain-containing protein [Fistulina hepatica ATCC 64428]